MRTLKTANRGLTLVELMVVMVIIAILASVAFPAYNAYVERSRRADGQAALLTAAQAMERCFVQTNDYGECPGPPAQSRDGFYALQLVGDDLGRTTFTITATPQAAHIDPRCGRLSITHTGQLGADGTLQVEECW